MSWNDKKPRRHNGKLDRNITREFVRKSEMQLGDRYEDAIKLGSYRNVFYNILCTEGLCPLELSLILWGNQFTFFTKQAISKNFYAGPQSIVENTLSLIEKGYIDEYSPRQEIKMEIDKGNYISTEEVMIRARYHLTRRGTQLCNMIADQFKDGVVDAFEREGRDYDAGQRFIGGLYGRPIPPKRKTPSDYQMKKVKLTAAEMIREREARQKIERGEVD